MTLQTPPTETESSMSTEQINKAIHEACGGDKLVGLKKRGFWYRPHAKGYTLIESDAGRYTMEEAKGHEYLHGEYDERVIIAHFATPDYCNDLGACFKLLDSMPQVALLKQDERWQVRRVSYEFDKSATNWFDTLPRAICEFYLKTRAA